MIVDILSLIDLTSLKGNETEEDITELCKKAATFHTAAVCVYPAFVGNCKRCLAENCGVKIASVVNFPGGNNTLTDTLAEISAVKTAGADEVDVVLPYQKWLHGDKSYAKSFVSFCKEACGDDIILKCILETGEIKESGLIYDATLDVIACGADFVKTSTGKTPVSATYQAAEYMIRAIRDSGRKGIGAKISGGIRTEQQALDYIKIASDIMDDDFIKPATFRFGASSLLDNLVKGKES